MEKAIYFLDYANINRSATDKGFDVDYAHLLNYLSEGRFLIDSYCYVPIDPRAPHQRDREIEELWSIGYVVNSKVGSIAGESYKCDFDVEITMDVIKTVHLAKPDIVILATGDVDFIPLILQLRKDGVRVEIASFDDSASRDLILKCSGFISLDKYYAEDYINAANKENEEIQRTNNQNFSDDSGISIGNDDIQ